MKKKTNKNTNKSKCWHARQGDVLIIATDKIPSNQVVTKKPTLAYGEVTGHHHTFCGEVHTYAETIEALAEYMRVVESPTSPATLTHQEHGPIEVPPGKYRAVLQTEYTPKELQRVRD